MPEQGRVYSTRRDSRLRVPVRDDARVWIERARTYNLEADDWTTGYTVNWRVPALDPFGQGESGYRTFREAMNRAEIVRMVLAIEAPVVVDPEIEGKADGDRHKLALETIAHDHAAHSELLARAGLTPSWPWDGEPRAAESIVLKWAQDIAREALKEKG